MVILRAIAALVLASVTSAAGADSKQVDQRPGYLGCGCTHDRNPSKKTSPSWLTVRYTAPGSPAERAGLRPGDLIVEIERRPLHFADDLDVILAFAKLPVGKPTKLTILRERRRHTVEIVPSGMPDAQYEQWKATLAMLKAERAYRERIAARPPQP